MKTFGVLFVAACFVAYAHSYPRTRDTENVDEEKKNVDTLLVLPSESREGFVRPMPFGFPDMSFDDSLDDSLENPGWTWYRPNLFDGYFSKVMQDMMTRLRQQLTNYFSRIPDITSLQTPEGGNTTSTVKVINGHVVTINETTYTSGDGDEMVFRVRVIEVKPENDTIPSSESEESGEMVTTLPTQKTTVDTTAAPPVTSNGEERTTPRNVETVEELDNEIPKNQVDTLTA